MATNLKLMHASVYTSFALYELHNHNRGVSVNSTHLPQ